MKHKRERANQEQQVTCGRLTEQHDLVMIELSAGRDAIFAENNSRLPAEEHSALMACQEAAYRGIQTLEDEHRRKQEKLIKSEKEANSNLKMVELESRAQQRTMERVLAMQEGQAEKNVEDL